MIDRADIDSPLRDTDPLLWNALRAAHLFDSIDISVLENEAGRAEALMAGKRLAKFIQREHPADDDEPMTTKWIDSLGGRMYSKVAADYFDHDTGIKIEFTGNIELGIILASLDRGDTVIEMKTRGDFRRLCKGLKIELKEKA